MWRRCSAVPRGPRATGCCESWWRRWTPSLWTHRSCCSWKICTGATRPPSTCCACWPGDVAAATAHPLRWVKHELQMHGYCDEIPLEFLSAAAVGQYLSRRFPGHGFPSELALVLHRNTDGNPLFLVNTIDYLIGQEQLREIDGQWQLLGPAEDIASRAPETLWQLVEKQVERLTPD